MTMIFLDINWNLAEIEAWKTSIQRLTLGQNLLISPKMELFTELPAG